MEQDQSRLSSPVSIRSDGSATPLVGFDHVKEMHESNSEQEPSLCQLPLEEPLDTQESLAETEKHWQTLVNHAEHAAGFKKRLVELLALTASVMQKNNILEERLKMKEREVSELSQNLKIYRKDGTIEGTYCCHHADEVEALRQELHRITTEKSLQRIEGELTGDDEDRYTLPYAPVEHDGSVVPSSLLCSILELDSVAATANHTFSALQTMSETVAGKVRLLRDAQAQLRKDMVRFCLGIPHLGISCRHHA